METIKNIGWALLAAIFIALCAQIEFEVPLNKENIPISGQTFAILLAAFFLGRWYAVLALLIYIVMGALGLPVFAGGASGIEKLYGGSAGYFGGFIYAAYIVGAYGERGWRRNLLKCIQAMFYGTLIILSLGVIRLLFIYSPEEALEVGFYPFIKGGVVKVLLGGIVAFGLERVLALLKSR